MPKPRKILIKESEFPKAYIEAVIHRGLSKGDFAQSIGLSRSRCSQYLSKYKDEINDLLGSNDHILKIKTEAEIARVFLQFRKLLDEAREQKNVELMSRYAQPVLTALKLLLQKEGIDKPQTFIQINQLTTKEQNLIVLPVARDLTKLILKYCRPEHIDACVKECDKYLSGLMNDALGPGPGASSIEVKGPVIEVKGEVKEKRRGRKPKENNK